MGGNPKVIVAVVLLVLAVIFFWRPWRNIASSEPTVGAKIFYDLGTGEIYPERDRPYPPVTAPSGKEGVEAVMFSCGNCDVKSDRFIGYLRKYTPEGKQAIKDALAAEDFGGRITAMEDSLIRRKDDADTDWADQISGEGQDIIAEVHQKCDSGRATPCMKYIE